MNIHDMLITYQRVNAKRLIDVSRDYPSVKPAVQTVDPPEPVVDWLVPTLQPGRSMPMTPMLKARFEYAGSWKKAHAGHEWLSLVQMKEVITDQEVLKQVEDRKEVWVDSLLCTYPRSKVSIFGLYPEQREEIYLIWPDIAGNEPAVLSYVGNYEEHYSNFGNYLQSLIRD